MKIYTEIIKSCSECPEYIWSTEYGDKCQNGMTIYNIVDESGMQN